MRRQPLRTLQLRPPSSVLRLSYHLSSMSYYLPPILWAALIFIASSNSDPLFFLSKDDVQFLKHIRFLGQSLMNLTWALSHIFVYAVLAFLLIRALANRRKFTSRLFWIVFAVTLLYGVSDEIHQIFIPNRGFQWYDILMDGLGALIGLGIYVMHWRKRAQDIRENGLLL